MMYRSSEPGSAVRSQCARNTIPARFAETVARWPDRIAVRSGGSELTYAELAIRVDGWTEVLQAQGCRSGDRVLLYLERGLPMLEMLLAVLQCGATYVPLDPEYPLQRTLAIAAETGTRLLIGETAAAPAFTGLALRFVALETLEADRSARPRPKPVPLDPGDPAYIIYTSGSTGRPKGVILPHEGVVNMAAAQALLLGADEHARVLQFYSFTFDASIFETFMALLNGGMLVLELRERLMQGRGLTDLVRAHGITSLQLPPAVLALLEPDDLSELRSVMVGGEVYPEDLVRRWGARFPLFNVYGPTEATCWTTVYRYRQQAAKLPIGTALPGVEVHLLDERGEPVAAEATGSLFIAGLGLAQGYVERPAETAERFLPCPFGPPGARMFRTGDLGRRDGEGQLHFLGRADQQLKIRGYRVEPAEVERCLQEHAAVARAAVVARRLGDEQHLVAFCLDRGPRVAPELLRSFVAERLPSYLVPSHIAWLDSFPTTANGKLDRRALPGLPTSLALADCPRPGPPLAEAVRAALGLTATPDLALSFPALGGTSLQALAVIDWLARHGELELGWRELLQAPRLADLDPRPLVAASTTEQPGPLSPAQERLFFSWREQPERSLHHLNLALNLHGPLEVLALERALARLLEHQPLLGARLEIDAMGGRFQTVPDRVLTLPVRCFSRLSDGESAARSLLEREGLRPYDPDQQLFRLALIRLTPSHHLLYFGVHHLVFDGWSVQVWVQALQRYYQAERIGATVARPRLDYGGTVDEAAREEHLSYWRRALLPLPELAPPPRDHEHVPEPTGRGGRLSFALEPQVATHLVALARQWGCTPFAVLLAAHAALLARLTGERDLIVGTVAANRSRPSRRETIGFFVLTLPLRLKLDPTIGFAALAPQVLNEFLEAEAHGDLPFHELVQLANPPRERGRTPLIATLLVYQDALQPAGDWPGCELVVEDLGPHGAEFDLQFDLVPSATGIAGTLTYAADTYEAATAERLLAYWLRLLEQGLAEPDRAWTDLELLSPAERARMLVECNDTVRSYPGPPSLHLALSGFARQRPDAPALIYEGTVLDYGALEARVTSLAQLLRSRGIGPEVGVGICMERSLDLIVALHGVLRAGGYYVPLDPDLPEARLCGMAADAGCALALVQAHTAVRLANWSGPFLAAEDFPAGAVASELPPVPDPDQAAYLIFTSGSTGRPKGVLVTHAAIANRLDWMQEAYGLSAADRVLQKTPIGFDVSVWELFWHSRVGAALVLARPGGHRDAEYLYRLMAETGVSTVHFVPSMLALFLEACPQPELPALKRVFCSGEALAPVLADQALRLLAAELHNLYGPTEAAVDVSYHACSAAAPRVPIGRPIANLALYVLDRELRPVPWGARGELFIGGVGLARGYRGRPGATAQAFLPHPFAREAGQRLYRTGDLAFLDAAGRIGYLGRLDHQVKLRGLRIELGEIENSLLGHEAVREAGVLALRENGELALVACLVCRRAVAEADLRQHLARSLPAYMVPARFLFLEQLLLSPNGKLDRRALMAQVQASARADQPGRAPSSPLERAIAEVWCACFGREVIGVDDDFFALGGHSLMATRLVMRLRQALGVELQLRHFFAAPTIAGLAAWLARSGADLDSEDEAEPDLLAESALDPSWSCSTRRGDAPPEVVFFTGATGFLGGFMVRELLRATRARVICLVRASSDREASARVEANMRDYGIWEADFAARIQGLAGDLALPGMGLRAEVRDWLAREVDTLFHNGAWVNFLEPFRRLRAANLEGTRQVLALAFAGRPKSVHYISSSSVFGTVGFFKGVRWLREDDDLELGRGYGFNGYVQTKWASERMVWTAKERGVDVRVYRLALVMGHSRTGVTNLRDFPSMMIKSCLQLGCYYDLPNKYDNFVPVDFAATSVVRLALMPTTVGKAFHVVNPHHIAYQDFWNLIVSLGYPMERLAFPEWIERFAAAAEHNELFPLLPLYLDRISKARRTIIELFQDTPFYDTRNLTEALGETGPTCPPIDRDLVATWFAHYRRVGFLPDPPAQPHTRQPIPEEETHVT